MILNSIVCIIVIPNLHDLNRRGNPALWYPTVVNFILFYASFWKNLNPSAGKRRTWIFFSAFFVLCSVSIMFNFSRFLPGIIKKIIPFPFLYYYLLYICQLLIIVFFYIKRFNLLPKKNLFFIALLVLLLFLSFIVEDIVRQLLILGLFTFIFAKIFLNNYLLFE